MLIVKEARTLGGSAPRTSLPSTDERNDAIGPHLRLATQYRTKGSHYERHIHYVESESSINWWGHPCKKMFANAQQTINF
jgi:hypothetical protein